MAEEAREVAPQVANEANAKPELSDGPDLEFHPVEIPGEPLSATILRERR